ncbi:MAG: MotA/TolQ/ExbB proton channel family protein [Alphaproteobacteria bacterium]|nr:MotA/TolQ/ExbB proton channel family protein [Alphaproteobacteria bacterium]
MISKHLTIAAAFVLLTGLSVGPVLAQATGGAQAPATTTAAPAAPAVAGPQVIKAPAVAAAPQENPYGLMDIIKKKDPVSYSVLITLSIMSLGSFFFFFTKYMDQNRILGQARTVERRFWTSSTLHEGIDKLPKNSMFRAIAEAGVKASQGGTTLVNQNDWIAMSLSRQLEDATGSLGGGGITWLASVGSVAPFVGLFGTVWGILKALLAIGLSGQPSIDKVAGPVGEALVMTAIGLFAAVPAVLFYNYLVRRNKVITEKLRGFAGDLQTYLVSKGK